MPITYSLDSSIATFLSAYIDITREQCDELAESLLSGKVSPVPIQGAFSYTLANSSQLVQFRASESLLDIELLQQARSIYGTLIANTSSHGQIGEQKPLSVYVIEKLPGITYMEYHLASGVSQRLDKEQYEKQRILIGDFARFFAASWKSPQTIESATISHDFKNKLDLLARGLPQRFFPAVSLLSQSLDLILESLPGVLTHGDLCEMNFLIDASNGHLTGIIDWAEAEVLPFGYSLWGLENILGYMDILGWHYFDGHEDLRALFWKTFYDTLDDNESLNKKRKAIDLARQMGILFRYGFCWVEGTQKRVVEEGDPGIRYLDALLLRREDYGKKIIG